MKTVTLVDGTIKSIEFGGDVVCGLCGEEYTMNILNSYCDETIACAGDDGESLVWVN